MTECTQESFEFAAHFSRRVVAEFSADRLTTDGGSPLLRQVDRRIGLLRRFAGCFLDRRDPSRIEHSVAEMVSQRVYALALGYEDLNDHEQLRHDPLLGLLAGKRELDSPLAGKSTLNRLELSPADRSFHALSQDQLLIGEDRSSAGRSVSGIAHHAATAHRARSGLDRHSAARASGAAFLSRLLQQLLLSAAVHLCRRSSVVCAAASGGSGRRGGCGRGSRAHR